MNIDFEDCLDSGNNSSFNSNKKTQEFEYLIILLEEESSLYTTKKYAPDYLEYLKKICGYEVNITTKKSSIIPWCGNYKNRENKKKIQSKVETAKFGIKESLCHKSTKIIKNINELIDNSLIKTPFGVSGSGHYLTRIHIKKISKELERRSELVNEEILQRVQDISSCFKGEKLLGTYRNEVDDFFQYKGTLIGDFEFEFLKEYKESTLKIKNYVLSQGYKEEYSIDSFVYCENGEEHLYSLSEINVRRTMGSSAIALKEKFFNNSKYFKFGILKNKFNLDHMKIKKYFKNQLFLLSPNDNYFHCYICAGSSENEIFALEREFARVYLE